MLLPKWNEFMPTTGESVSPGLSRQDGVVGSKVPLGINSVPASSGAGPRGCPSDPFRFQRCLTKPSLVKAFARFVMSSLNGAEGKLSRGSERFLSDGSLFQDKISQIRMIPFTTKTKLIY